MLKEPTFTPDLSIFNRSDLLQMKKNNFTAIEWTDNQLDLKEVMKKTDAFNSINELLKKRRLRVYLEKRNDMLFIIISTNENAEHKYEYSGLLPNKQRDLIKVAGTIQRKENTEEIKFIHSSVSLDRKYLSREKANHWIN